VCGFKECCLRFIASNMKKMGLLCSFCCQTSCVQPLMTVKLAHVGLVGCGHNVITSWGGVGVVHSRFCHAYYAGFFFGKG